MTPTAFSMTNLQNNKADEIQREMLTGPGSAKCQCIRGALFKNRPIQRAYEIHFSGESV